MKTKAKESISMTFKDYIYVRILNHKPQKHENWC
uniref:Uncharacterized protein n=1 Tax=Arundo donax TaxID=35708 RepID=A0A0A8ZKW0_ARUDO